MYNVQSGPEFKNLLLLNYLNFSPFWWISPVSVVKKLGYFLEEEAATDDLEVITAPRAGDLFTGPTPRSFLASLMVEGPCQPARVLHGRCKAGNRWGLLVPVRYWAVGASSES